MPVAGRPGAKSQILGEPQYGACPRATSPTRHPAQTCQTGSASVVASTNRTPMLTVCRVTYASGKAACRAFRPSRPAPTPTARRSASMADTCQPVPLSMPAAEPMVPASNDVAVVYESVMWMMPGCWFQWLMSSASRLRRCRSLTSAGSGRRSFTGVPLYFSRLALERLSVRAER